jgi:sugar phosphate isomerase/epimerase
MKIGFPTHPRKDVLKEIEWIGKNGFDFVDLFLEEDKAVPENIDAKKVRNLLDKYKLGVVGHTAWYLPIGSPAKSIREAAISEAGKYFRVFSKVGAKYVAIHSDWPHSLFSENEGVEFQVWTLKKLVSEARKYRLTVIYEPIGIGHDSIKNVSEILRKVPGLYLHLDIGHANLCGRSPEDFIRKFHNRLRHVHMHDNNGKDDLHLPIGTGSIKWDRLIKVLKKHYDGTITLEIFSKDKDYALLSREKLKKLWARKN